MNWSNSFKRLGIFLTMIAITGFFTSTIVHAEYLKDKKNVLIINSYHEGFTWTQKVMDGVFDVLPKSASIIDTSVEYLDWKNYPSEENLNSLAAYYKQKYQNRKIDVIITSDDAALEFALQHRGEFLSNAPVVFCGVNEVGYADIASGYENVTGILEQVDPGDTIELAIGAMPELKKIYLVYDNTESGYSSGQIALKALRGLRPDIEGINLNGMTYEEVFDAVENVPENSAIFIVSFYTDTKGQTLSFEENCEIISQISSVPVFNLYDFTVGHGAIGGSMLSGNMQGEKAAEIALRVLGGESASNIPISHEKTVRQIYDYTQLVRFNIPLSRIGSDSEIINKPFSFFETYKTLVFVVIGIITLLTMLTLLLAIYNRKLRAAEKKLQESYQEMESTYEELFATQGELSVKYEEMKDYQEKLHQSAYHDALTGLPNRLSLYEKLREYFKSAPRELSALMYIDSDNFKFINDTMGHSFGDKFITEIGKRLSLLMGSNQIIFRLGGDEFIICCYGIEDVQAIEDFAANIIKRVNAPFVIGDSFLYITVSIGIAIYPEHGTNTDELMQHADIAMYRAKAAGKNKYFIFNNDLQTVVKERMNIEKNLRSALIKNEFLLHYQPQLDIATGKITGFEALIRWNNPELGLVPPLRFIGIAEETHLIISIGEWVLRNSCLFLKKLHDNGHPDLSMAVNISILQLLQEDFTDTVLKTVEWAGLEPQHLELEITESVLMQSFQAISEKLHRLREAGIKIALDDFGQGYSSLSYLKRLPIHTLKIDKCFIDSINSKNPKDNFIDTIILIGRKMGLIIVAEGVENAEQMDYLVRHKCDKVQGYLISRPVPQDEAVKLLV